MIKKHTLILAHGAGAPMDSEWMNTITELLKNNGVEVHRFEFPYMIMRRKDGKKRPPNTLKVLLDTYSTIVNKFDGKVFVGGKSMGGRIATMIADSHDNIIASIGLGYPFHPPKYPQKLRTKHLKNMKSPCLIIQGEKDPFGKITEWDAFNLAPTVFIYPLIEANHELKPLKRTGLSHRDALRLCVEQMIQFMDKHND